jgi:DNA invertase Pin-like site-specific DNA recombinase
MRNFQPNKPEETPNDNTRRLHTNRPIGVYARRSDPYAKDKQKDRTQSREMQTDDMISWHVDKDWASDIVFPYFADLGLSGTLRPDQRPDMLRLFDDIDAGKYDHGTVACFQENRLFRDDTHIYYNQFIDKLLQHDILLIVHSPRLYIYDMRDEHDKGRLREKLEEAAEFIPRQIKGWLHPARERAAKEYGEWAGLGDINIGYIIDYDEKSKNYKK